MDVESAGSFLSKWEFAIGGIGLALVGAASYGLGTAIGGDRAIVAAEAIKPVVPSSLCQLAVANTAATCPMFEIAAAAKNADADAADGGDRHTGGRASRCLGSSLSSFGMVATKLGVICLLCDIVTNVGRALMESVTTKKE